MGAVPVIFPLVVFAPPEDFAPLDAGLRHLGDFDWLIFTSENAVQTVADRLASLGLSLQETGAPRCVAAVGPTTAGAAERAGFSVSYSAKTHSGVALANELGETVRGMSVFLPRSNRANPDLPAALQLHGAQVIEAIAYKTLPPPDLDQPKFVSAALECGSSAPAFAASAPAHAILFFSPTAVEHLVQSLGAAKLRDLQNEVALVAVGPITATALQKLEIMQIVVAAETSAEAVVEALKQHFSSTEKHSIAGVRRE
jgi:uroporphyrinogen-III synthase